MPKFEIKLVRREEAALGTMSFYFEKPAGLAFKAGQNADYTLINPPETDAEGNTRTFSFSSAPHEPEIMITSRMRDSAFKRVLKTMPLGTAVQFEGPMGSMMLHHDTSRPAVFIAGGIGITPFLSMTRQVIHEKLPHHIYLFYSNRKPVDAAFLRELTDMKNENHNFHLIATMTDADEESWDGETGRVSAPMIEKYLANEGGGLNAPIYYLAGPPAMSTGVRMMLNQAGIDDDYIKSEEFSGY